jgi:hypothetical protein
MNQTLTSGAGFTSVVTHNANADKPPSTATKMSKEVDDLINK